MAYKLDIDIKTGANLLRRLSDDASIPFDPANTDYAEFKKAVTAGAELQDVDGNVMSPEAAQAFVATLP
jgi:hypothetical protein